MDSAPASAPADEPISVAAIMAGIRRELAERRKCLSAPPPSAKTPLASRGSPDERYVDSLFALFFGRPADEHGLAHYRQLLASGARPAEILSQIMRSPECQEASRHEAKALFERLSAVQAEARRINFTIPAWLVRMRGNPLLSPVAKMGIALLHLARLPKALGLVENAFNLLIDHSAVSLAVLAAEDARARHALLESMRIDIEGFFSLFSPRVDALERRAERTEAALSAANEESLAARAESRKERADFRAAIEELRSGLGELRKEMSGRVSSAEEDFSVRLDEVRKTALELNHIVRVVLPQQAESLAERLAACEAAALEGGASSAKLAAELSALTAKLDESHARVRGDMAALSDRLSQVRGSIGAVEARVGEAQSAAEETRRAMLELNHLARVVNTQSIANNSARLSSLEQRLAQFDDMRRQLAEVRGVLADWRRRLESLIAEARRRMPEPLDGRQIKAIAEADFSSADLYYELFEDRFRGTSGDIRCRLEAAYAPVLRSLPETVSRLPFLDIACGRGEWLDFLAEAGHKAIGVDCNARFVEECRARGLDVTQADALAFLAEQKSARFGLVTAFHFVEHIPTAALGAFLDEVFRILRPGGVLILETPNPENVLTGACNFYMDFTHVRPIPPAALQALVEDKGFIGVETLRMNPNTSQAAQDPVVNTILFGPQDYAIVARKA